MKRSRKFSISKLNCLERHFSGKLGCGRPTVKVSKRNVKCVKFSVSDKVPTLKDRGIFALPKEGLLVDLNIALEYSEAYIKKHTKL